MKLRHVAVTMVASLVAFTVAQAPLAEAAPPKSSKSESVSMSPDGPHGIAPRAVVRFIPQTPGDPTLSPEDVGAESGFPEGWQGSRASLIPQKIIGADERQRTTPTTTGINSAIVQISFIVPGTDESSHCTGIMVSADVVVTAGHCLYNRSDRSGRGVTDWIDVKNITVIPALDGDELPYGFCSTVAWLSSVKGWTDDGDSAYDYGALKLDQCPIGNATGTIGLAPTSGDVSGVGTILRGYPYDKDQGTTMWYTAKPIEVSDGRQLYYKHDTDVGQSGSALIGDCPGGNGLCSVGIHTNGHEINNFGVRMIDEVYDNLVSWLDD